MAEFGQPLRLFAHKPNASFRVLATALRVRIFLRATSVLTSKHATRGVNTQGDSTYWAVGPAILADHNAEPYELLLSAPLFESVGVNAAGARLYDRLPVSFLESLVAD